MASCITSIVNIGQDLMSSVSERFDLHNPACIVAVASGFILLFLVAKIWTHAGN